MVAINADDDGPFPQGIDPGESGSAELFDEPQRATVSFDRPKKRMGGVRKTLVGLCALAGGLGGFQVGVATPSPTDFVSYHLEEATRYSKAELAIAENFGKVIRPQMRGSAAVYRLPANVNPEISAFYHDMKNKKEKELRSVGKLRSGGLVAFKEEIFTNYWVLWDTAMNHYNNARVSDLRGTQAPGLLGAGLGALLLAGLSYELVKRRK